jgi:predicted porin
VGFALDNKTDLTVGYAIYKADTYVDNSRWSQPFGAADETHTVTATLARQLTKQIRGTVQYSYARNRDGASGGQNNYDAHMIYAFMQYRF